MRTAPVALVTDDLVDDRLLVQRSTQGDEDAFRSLVERHQGDVYNLVRQLVGGADSVLRGEGLRL